MTSEPPRPAGRTAHTLWMSDEPVSVEVWARFRADHARSGLWPLLLDSSAPDDAGYPPWASGGLFPEEASSPEAHDPADLLAGWWSTYTAVEEDEDVLSPAERLAVTAPFGQDWPGLAPDLPTAGADPDADADADDTAAGYAAHLLTHRPHLRLGLVAAGSGAAALAAVGWHGPANYDGDTGKYAAVVADWERRFGARVVAVGHDTLHLGVAAPPRRREDALRVAAEHFAFCPDNVWQSQRPYTLEAYAERLVDTLNWDFWWD
ncbi:DUF4253 domain-containing protein [Streptomyces sp. 4N509B]|uniref:DUF4253 domain-containing protein n=1 Tax=Streptomyces sp. 4N509B TaxID=3457413 RepID=UPI003FCF707E